MSRAQALRCECTLTCLYLALLNGRYEIQKLDDSSESRCICANPFFTQEALQCSLGPLQLALRDQLPLYIIKHRLDHRHWHDTECAANERSGARAITDSTSHLVADPSDNVRPWLVRAIRGGFLEAMVENRIDYDELGSDPAARRSERRIDQYKSAALPYEGPAILRQ